MPNGLRIEFLWIRESFSMTKSDLLYLLVHHSSRLLNIVLGGPCLQPLELSRQNRIHVGPQILSSASSLYRLQTGDFANSVDIRQLEQHEVSNANPTFVIPWTTCVHRQLDPASRTFQSRGHFLDGQRRLFSRNHQSTFAPTAQFVKLL